MPPPARRAMRRSIDAASTSQPSIVERQRQSPAHLNGSGASAPDARHPSRSSRHRSRPHALNRGARCAPGRPESIAMMIRETPSCQQRDSQPRAASRRIAPAAQCPRPQRTRHALPQIRTTPAAPAAPVRLRTRRFASPPTAWLIPSVHASVCAPAIVRVEHDDKSARAAAPARLAQPAHTAARGRPRSRPAASSGRRDRAPAARAESHRPDTCTVAPKSTLGHYAGEIAIFATATTASGTARASISGSSPAWSHVSQHAPAVRNDDHAVARDVVARSRG